MATILVLNGAAHGIPSTRAATDLRDRLSEWDIIHAASEREEFEHISDAEIAVGGSMNTELLAEAESLKLFACSSAGVGHLDLDAFEKAGVAVTNASGVHGPNMAEHVIGWILMITRRLDYGIELQERHEWRHFQTDGELYGSTVCVVGLGAIGQAIVERLEPFGVELIGVRYSPEKGGPTDEVYGFDEIGEAVISADYVLVACPLTDTTRGLIDGDVLGAMHPDSVLVNVGRGPIVDTDALVRTIQSNGLRAAALDVTDPEPLPPDHPLWGFSNVYITPHNSGHTPLYWERVGDILLENLERVEETGEYDDLKNQVA